MQTQYVYRGSWVTLFRPLTLSGTISPILVATALSAMTGEHELHLGLFIGMLVAAICVQIATNIFNDYFDFANGQDQDKWTIQKSTEDKHGPLFKQLPFVAYGFLIIAALIGIWLAIESSFLVLILGAVSIIFGYLYSGGPKPLNSIGFGEVVAAVFLGLMVTHLTFVVQTNTLNGSIILISIIFALLIATMILTNNIRDIQKDRAFRATLATILGKQRAIHVLILLLVATYGWTFGLMIVGILPWRTSIVLLALPFAWQLIHSFRKQGIREDEIRSMKRAALHHWTFGLLFACSLWIPLLF